MGDPRWSPGGGRLGWTDSFDGRTDLVVGAADGSTPPVVVTADGGVGGGWCWAGDDEVVVVAGDGSLVAIASRRRRRGACSPATGGAVAPAVSARGEVACAIERDDACDVAMLPLDGSSWPVRVSHADYAWDPAWSPDGALLAWHEWDLPDMPWDASRVVIRRVDGESAREAEGRVKIGGDAVAASQPRFSPDGVAARVRLRRRRLAGAVGRRSRRRQRASGARRATRARRARVGPGPTVVRVVARRHGARVVPQRETASAGS